MNLKSSAISIALASVLSASTAQAQIIYMDYTGLLTMLDPQGAPLQNTSYPYYGDTSWGYGIRTQISGTIQLNTSTGSGSASVNPFEFFHGGMLVTSNFELQAIGNSLLIGNMNISWAGSDISSQIIWNASGLFSELPTVAYGDVYDTSTCLASGACATPASDQIKKNQYPIGPSPIATTSFNTIGQAGLGTTINQLSLGTDDGIGGSPIYTPPYSTFTGFSPNLDITSISITSGPDLPQVPVPAAIWLFGSGLIGLTALARRKKFR